MLARLTAPLALLVLLFSQGGCHVVPPAHQVDGESEADASDPPASSQQDEADAITAVERMLSMSVAGQVLGVIETRLEKLPDGRQTVHERVTVSMTRQGGGPEARFDTVTESVTHYSATHELISETEIEREAGITVTRTLTLEGREIVSFYSGPGRPEQIKRFTLPEDYRSALAVENELVEQWRQTGEPATQVYATFDPERERFERVELSITGEAQVTHAGETIPAYVFRTKEEDGTVVDAIVDHDLMALKVSAAGTFVASLVQEAPVLGEGGSGTINSELPVLGRSTNQWWELAEQKVTVTVKGDDPEAPALWEDNHYHQVTRTGEAYELTLLATRPRPGFVAPQLPLRLEDPELLRYLEPTVSAQSDNPALIAEAQRIVASESNALRAAAKIVDAVFRNLDKQAGMRGAATATEVLANGAGDCTEHAVLVVALMRAAGIPARAVDGIVLVTGPSGEGMSGYHAWAEIWLGEWIGVDATVNETGTSARYLQFGIDEPGSMSSGGKLMRSIGKTTIELGPHSSFEERDG